MFPKPSIYEGTPSAVGILAATEQAIERAAAALRGGALVAFPTETVYGLGADATNARAVAAIFEAKGRPRFNPLIVHVMSVGEAAALADLTNAARKLAEAFWPGPLTLVLSKRPGCPVAELATAGLDTLAVRVPVHPVAQALLRAANLPIAAPSANRSGHVSPTMAVHVEADLGKRVAMILDGGATPVGLESTVIDVTGEVPMVLRLGGVTREAIARVLGQPVETTTGAAATPASPGMLARHYAPITKLRLDVQDVREGEALLAFGPNAPRTSRPAVNLSPSGDLAEAAANLFAALRKLDASGAEAIAVMPIPDKGLGEAINDRLRRAARAE
jgi:L-threonylcarbamoyladenylate synthase